MKIYIADVRMLYDEKIYNDCYGRLPLYRKEKADKISALNGRIQSVGAGVLYTIALQNEGTDPYKQSVKYGFNEKPYIEGSDNLWFSLSHSNNKVMAIVSDAEVGADVELIGKDRMNVAKRFFCREEYEFLMNYAEDVQEQKIMFTRMWTLKESFMKVTGLGMKLKLSDFLIKMEEDIKVIWDGDDRKYYFKQIIDEDNYVYSFCQADKAIENVKVECVNIAQWLNKET